MRRARCVLGIARDVVSEAEPNTVRNCHRGGNSVPVANGHSYGHPNADRLANPERFA